MGDNDEGSSSAAQSALSPKTESRPGIFGRFLASFKNDADAAAEASPRSGAGQHVVSDVPSMLNLRRMRLEDVAVPKADIISVPCDIKKEDLVQVFRDSGLSRLPVYDGTLDSPIGLVHLKDLALQHGFNGKGSRYNLKKMVRPLIFAPPSMPIGVLLQKMQNDRTHMALVVDEYGGVDGLVTIEDLIEQVIGEIQDEHDIAEGRFWTLEKPGCYLAEAKTPLIDFEAEIGHDLVDDEVDEEIDTLGGLVFFLSGRIPSRGEVIPHGDGFEFEIVDADPRRINRLRVRLPSHTSDG